MANTEAAVRGQVALLNRQLVSGYQTAFDNWSISVIAGRGVGDGPPRPPKGFIVGHFTDATNDRALWAYPATGPDPVCAMPELPHVAPPYVAPVMPEPEHIRGVPAGDVMPVGYIAIDAAGFRWQKRSSATPFGVAYFYERLTS